MEMLPKGKIRITATCMNSTNQIPPPHPPSILPPPSVCYLCRYRRLWEIDIFMQDIKSNFKILSVYKNEHQKVISARVLPQACNSGDEIWDK